jgi:hypothetical protein
MDLQNGYKVIYEKAADGKRTFYASTTGVFADADVIAETAIGQYKLIYEKAGKIYGSESGVPAEGDYCFKAFDKVFKVAEDEDEVVETPEEPTNEDVPVEMPKGEIETPTEEESEF